MQDHDTFDWNQSYSGDVTDYAEPDSEMLDIIDGLGPGRALDIGCGVDLHVSDATTWKPASHYDLITNSFALPGSKTGRASVYRMIRSALASGGTVLLKDFDSTMSRLKYFAQYDLVTVGELTAAFNDLNIIRAEIVETPVHDHNSSGRQPDGHWTAALLHARNS